ncbi:MAG TPA: signal peptidase I, partial [Bryobacteraceae bacterium]|nr:signal peptidase I [Bryobacteraceae bacterium]
AILIPLFLFAGRSLARTGAPGGRLWPWAAVSLATTVPLIFFQILVVPTGMMADTLLPGDRILVLHFPKPHPGRGDVIIFHYPIDRRQMYVDRVIGLPGDRIRISGKTVYRNGAALREPYAVHKTTYTDAYRDNFPAKPAVTLYDSEREMLAKDVVNGELVVPAGKYFVLGDNRDLALDSRFWGFVDSGDLIGQALLIYDSEEPAAGTTGAAAGATHHVRWNRLFKLL